MNEIMKSVEGCRVDPIPPKIVSTSDYYRGDNHKVLGNFVWVGACIASFVVLANIPEDKPGWIWFAPFVIPFFVRSWLIDTLNGRDAENYRVLTNEQNREQSSWEADSRSESVRNCVSSAIEDINLLKVNIARTSTLIQQAKAEFDQNAYSPFWDKIHASIEQLSECNENIENLERHAAWYSKGLNQRSHNFPAYPISAGLVPDITRTSQGLRQVIRLGQTSFEFSSIYEQIRTREVMIAGFKSLGEAVDNFGSSVDLAFSRFLSQLETTIRKTNNL
jgi:hypothetical protein